MATYDTLKGEVVPDRTMATYDTLKGEVVPAGREPLTDAQKDAIFDDIDTDKNGTLDLHEFSVYIQGKYSITRDTAKQIFKCNDLDGNNTFDKTEFRALLGKIDDVNIEMERQKDIQVTKHLTCAAKWGQCGCITCCCTLGCSCYFAAYCASKELLEMTMYVAEVEALREAKLVASLTMDREVSEVTNPLS
jgi:hypothetical protein